MPTRRIPARMARGGASAVLLVLIACGGGGHGTPVVRMDPVPAITALAPANIPAGSAGFSLSVTGSGFTEGATVLWNGASLATGFVDAAHLTASVPATDVASAGTASVRVEAAAPDTMQSGAATFSITTVGGAPPYLRNSVSYNSYPGSNSDEWVVVLPNVLAGSTIYVVGTWPNFSSNYPSMQVTDGTNAYALLDRYDDRIQFNLGIQGTQSVGHWYASNVPAGTYTVHLAPTSDTFEDLVGLVAFEVAGVSASPLDGHALQFQPGVAPGADTLTAAVSSASTSGLLVAVAVDTVDSTAPTAPLPGSNATDAGELWDFFGTGKPAGRAEYQRFVTPESHIAHFGTEESGAQLPDYITVAAFFDALGSAPQATTLAAAPSASHLHVDAKIPARSRP